MQAELLVGERQRDRRRFEIGEEELEEGQVAQLRRLCAGWPSHARSASRPAGVIVNSRRRRPISSRSSDSKPSAGETGRLLVQERVRERPDVADRRGDVALELVRRRGPFALEKAEDEVRGWGQRDLECDRVLD